MQVSERCLHALTSSRRTDADDAVFACTRVCVRVCDAWQACRAPQATGRPCASSSWRSGLVSPWLRWSTLAAPGLLSRFGADAAISAEVSRAFLAVSPRSLVVFCTAGFSRSVVCLTRVGRHAGRARAFFSATYTLSDIPTVRRHRSKTTRTTYQPRITAPHRNGCMNPETALYARQ